MKYWEIIIENLRNAGWNCGSMATSDGKGRLILVVAAEREDAGRFIVHADEKLTAFMELEAAIRACSQSNQTWFIAPGRWSSILRLTTQLTENVPVI